MKLQKIVTMMALSLATTASALAENVPAFPGAEGFARYTTTGGRGAKAANVFHVTRLVDDSSKGSLRWALEQAKSKNPATIVFDVSGYIDLQKDLNIYGNVTVAGQTAPGDGITLRYRTVVFKGSNTIVRFLRFRRSQIKDVNDGADAAWGRNNQNIILDHCSFSWSIDELASFYDNRNFTMQWCVLGEALRNPGHSKGEHSYGGIWGGKGASFHHNMLCHMQNRVPRFNGARYNYTNNLPAEYENCVQAEQVDFRNCLMYNWGNGNGCYGGPGGGYVNIVNNYYKAGPATVNGTRVTEVSVANEGNSKDNSTWWGYASRYYINGNYVTAATKKGDKAENYDWKGVKYDDGLKTSGGEKYIPDAKHAYGSKVTYKKIDGTDCVQLKLTEPIEYGHITTHSAQDAYEAILAYAGASLSRDAIDARYMEEAQKGTTTYKGTATKDGKGSSITPLPGIIDLIQDHNATVNSKLVAYPALKSETRPANWDTDGDGMPDAWEEANGLDKNNANDGALYTLDKKKWYTNLEVYLNSIVESIMKSKNAGGTANYVEYYPSVATAIETAREQTSAIKSVTYLTTNGVVLSAPRKGINLRRITYSDGSVVTDKVMMK